jgi:hypothetical protein
MCREIYIESNNAWNTYQMCVFCISIYLNSKLTLPTTNAESRDLLASGIIINSQYIPYRKPP